jgi:hypothetical protein
MNYSSLKPFVLISASRASWPCEANDDATESLRSQLAARDFDFVQVRGCYKGKEEDSFLVLCDPIADDYELGMLIGLANRHGQESILLVDAQRHATLFYLGSDPEAIPGTFQAVSVTEARQCDAWTRRDNVYYIIK